MRKQLSATDYTAIEATLTAMFWGDVDSFCHEKKLAPVWKSKPDPRWERYTTWLSEADRQTRRKHLEMWSVITTRTLQLGNMPLMDRETGTALDTEAQAVITKLLDGIAALHRESETPTHTVATSSAIH